MTADDLMKRFGSLVPHERTVRRAAGVVADALSHGGAVSAGVLAEMASTGFPEPSSAFERGVALGMALALASEAKR